MAEGIELLVIRVVRRGSVSLTDGVCYKDLGAVCFEDHTEVVMDVLQSTQGVSSSMLQ